MYLTCDSAITFLNKTSLHLKLCFFKFLHVCNLLDSQYHFSSVTQLCPMDPNPWTAPHQASLSITKLPELAQIHVHQLDDAVQPSHPLSSPSPPAFNLCQQSESFPISQFFPSGGQRIGVSASASVLPMNIQD